MGVSSETFLVPKPNESFEEPRYTPPNENNLLCADVLFYFSSFLLTYKLVGLILLLFSDTAEIVASLCVASLPVF